MSLLEDHIETGRPRRHEVDSAGSPGWKKFLHYNVEVDPAQDDKSKEIFLCSFARPHMRAFHCNWWSFFVAFFIWFSISPLLGYIRKDLNLTKQDIWNSSLAGVGGTILLRLILGPLCDVYGARVLSTLILCTISIPTACTGLVNSAMGLNILRLFIGMAGGSFVTNQYWASRMFTKEVVGTASGLVAGWGNLGAGVAQLVIGTVLLPIFTAMCGGNTEMAWRTVCIVPAVIAFITGIVIYRISDDAPKGNYSELKANGIFPEVTATSSFIRASLNWNSWFLAIQYAACFGVELTMYNAVALYFRDVYGLSSEAAGALVSIFGWLNLFARGLGGFISDYFNYRWGMCGRLWAQTICLFAEGSFVLIFASCSTLGASVATLVCFSVFVAFAKGTSYAIVPYVDPPNMGSVIGIVGAGGNVGAVLFGLGFRNLGYSKAFLIMGCCIIGSSFLSILIRIKGYSGLICGHERRVNPETGELITIKDQSRSNNDDEAVA